MSERYGTFGRDQNAGSRAGLRPSLRCEYRARQKGHDAALASVNERDYERRRFGTTSIAIVPRLGLRVRHLMPRLRAHCRGVVWIAKRRQQCRQFKERCAVRRVGDSDAASAPEVQFPRQAPGYSEAGIAASSGTVVGSSGLNIVPQYPAGAGIQNWPSATNTGFPAMPS